MIYNVCGVLPWESVMLGLERVQVCVKICWLTLCIVLRRPAKPPTSPLVSLIQLICLFFLPGSFPRTSFFFHRQIHINGTQTSVRYRHRIWAKTHTNCLYDATVSQAATRFLFKNPASVHQQKGRREHCSSTLQEKWRRENTIDMIGMTDNNQTVRLLILPKKTALELECPNTAVYRWI